MDKNSSNGGGNIVAVGLEERMQSAYLDYAMSVIVGRALPDVRDGLKPVHRRILHAMNEAGNVWNKPYKKSARIVGDVLGKYHPHGGDAVYDALVRMAQDFSLRYPLVDGQGNFGSVDGDNPAAMRYTEVRMARIAQTLLEDIEKETVDFSPNYDNSEKEPDVLPARLPNLLVGGAAGIAVGVATNIPPHNLSETVNACIHLLKNEEATIDELMKFIPAPDFPTAGIIYGLEGARQAYRTGRGRVVVRARAKIEDAANGRRAIIVEELPYQVNKAALVARIAELARAKKLEGVADLRDESDRRGVRVVIELRRGENAEVALNRLYKETQLQNTFSVNFVALVDGEPRELNLREMLAEFLRHRREVVARRTIFDLNKARARAHLLEGLAVALANVERMVELIKTAPSPADAKERLLEEKWKSNLVAKLLASAEDAQSLRPETLAPRFGLQNAGTKTEHYRLSPAQAQAILDMRLARLTGLERDKISEEYAETIKAAADFLRILASPARITKIIEDELTAVKKQFGDERRSEIVVDGEEFEEEDLIAREEMAVTLSHRGYIKRQPLTDYRTQKRGGRGKQAAAKREDDFMEMLFVANTHDHLLIFTNRGRVYWQKVHQLPLAARASRGRPIVNLLPLMEHEKVQAVLPVRAFDDNQFVVMATANGTVKKTPLSAYSRPRRGGIIAIGLDEQDALINAVITNGGHRIMLFSEDGKAMRFHEKNVRSTGRSARGVRGMRLEKERRVVSMLSAEDDSLMVLTATEKGFGKRTKGGEYPTKGRGGKGVITLKVTEKTGAVVGAAWAGKDDELMLISDGGILIRTQAGQVRAAGRNTQGVRLIKLEDGSKLIAVARVAEQNGDDENGDSDSDSDNSASADK